MKVLFHLVYRCIFYLLSRRLKRIVVLTLKITYSFSPFGAGPTRAWCSYVSCSAFSCSSFLWQHVPDSSFSLVCILQVCFSFIDILHTLLAHVRIQCNYRHHRCPRVLLKNSDIHNYNFYSCKIYFHKSSNQYNKNCFKINTILYKQQIENT